MMKHSQLKEELTPPSILALYNPNVKSTISADASSHGLGTCFRNSQTNGIQLLMLHVP